MALRSVLDRLPTPPACFNPRPPFPVGATDRFEADATAAHVSILAHRFQWALPGARLEERLLVMFQSSPTVSSGRYCTTSPAPRNKALGPGLRELAVGKPKFSNDHLAV